MKYVWDAHVRVGSKTVLTTPQRDFRSTPINGHQQTGPTGPVRARRRPMHRGKMKLFNHFVGRGEQRRWQFEAKRLRGLEIDDKFKCCGPLDRQIRRLDPLEHLPDVDA